MFQIDDDMTIYITRGDVAFFTVTAENNGEKHKFQPGDVVRIKVFAKKDATNVAFQKDFPVLEESEKVDILLTEQETKIGDVISKPVDYWYEIELNPYTNSQTIIGYDDDGPKIFKLFPEGRDLRNTEVEEEDIPVVDTELILTSQKPVENQAITRAIIRLGSEIAAERERISKFTSGEDVTDTYGKEVYDVRIDVNGRIHSSAGDSVRGQIRDLKSELLMERADRNEAINNEKERAIARENEIEKLFSMPAQEAVNKWLDEHPEATTTVQDKSLTIDKMVVGTLGYITPQMFGAVGDGVTDDTTAIQNAIDAAKTTTGVCYFPQGTYKISSTLNVSKCVLRGCGVGDTTRSYTSGSIIVIEENATMFHVDYDTTIEGLIFYYPLQNGATEEPIEYLPTITFDNVPSMVIRDCVFLNSFICIDNLSMESGAVGKILIDGVYAYAIKTFLNIKDAYDTVIVSGSFITAGVYQDVALTGEKYLAKYTVNNGIAFNLAVHTDDFRLIDSLIWGYSKGIACNGSWCNMLKVSNVHFDGVPCGVYFDTYSQPTNITISDCQFFGLNALYEGEWEATVCFTNTYESIATITGCIFEGFKKHAIKVRSSRQIIIANNNIHNFDYAGVYVTGGKNISINNNHFYGNNASVEGNYGVQVLAGETATVFDNIFEKVFRPYVVSNITDLFMENNINKNSTSDGVASNVANKRVKNNLFPIHNNVVKLTIPEIPARGYAQLTFECLGAVPSDVIAISSASGWFESAGIMLQAYVAENDVIRVNAYNFTDNVIATRTTDFVYNYI